MAIQNFERGLKPNIAMGIGKHKDDDKIKRIDYNDLEKQIAMLLRALHENFKNNGTIYALSRYGGDVPRTYTRKMVDLDIIKRITASKKNMQYIWNSGDDPDYEELAHKVIISSVPRQKSNKPVKNYGSYASKITMLLIEKGVEKGKILEITEEIMQIIYPDSD